MLFDLQGKRRRVVQATYLTLAILMGGGLVLFGIGGDVQGGLFDAFSGEGGNSSSGNSIDREARRPNEKKLQGATRSSEAARKELVRDYYQLATAQADARAAASPTTARPTCARRPPTGRPTWRSSPEKPDTSLARAGAAGLRPDRAQQAQGAARRRRG